MPGRDSQTEPVEDAPSDGRRRRSHRSRERILNSLAEVLTEPGLDLSPEQIAARSGFSLSTIFRHFGDRQGVDEAMRELVNTRVTAQLAVGPFEGDRATRIAELVRRLSAVFEITEPFLRNLRGRAQAEMRRESLEQLDAVVRAVTRNALPDAFASEGADDRFEMLSVALSFSAWGHMRITQGLDIVRARRLLREPVRRLLDAPELSGAAAASR